MRIAIFRKNLGKYSESFVRRNLERINNGETVAVCVQLLDPGKFDWIPKSRVLVLSNYPRWTWKQVIRLFFLRHNVRGAVVEFLDWASDMAPVLNSLGVPCVALAHGYDVGRNLGRSPAYKQKLLKLNTAEKILFPSRFLEAIFKASVTLAADRLATVPIGVNTSKLRPAPATEKRDHLLFVGRFVEKKAPLALLLALKLARDRGHCIQLRLAGDGTLLPAARLLVKSLKLEGQVVFLGVLPHEKALEEIRAARGVLLPSVTADDGDIEGMPIILQEALSLGTPAISTRHSGIPEVIEDQQTGYLVDEYDCEALADRMIKLNTLPAEEYNTMCSAARERAIAHFDENRRIERINSWLGIPTSTSSRAVTAFPPAPEPRSTAVAPLSP